MFVWKRKGSVSFDKLKENRKLEIIGTLSIWQARSSTTRIRMVRIKKSGFNSVTSKTFRNDHWKSRCVKPSQCPLLGRRIKLMIKANPTTSFRGEEITQCQLKTYCTALGSIIVLHETVNRQKPVFKDRFFTTQVYECDPGLFQVKLLMKSGSRRMLCIYRRSVLSKLFDLVYQSV